jgi:hypothetical protein
MRISECLRCYTGAVTGWGALIPVNGSAAAPQMLLLTAGEMEEGEERGLGFCVLGSRISPQVWVSGLHGLMPKSPMGSGSLALVSFTSGRRWRDVRPATAQGLEAKKCE